MHTTALDTCKANVLQVLHMCHAFSKLGHEVILSVPQGHSPVAPESLVKSRLGIKEIMFKIKTYEMRSFFGRLKTLFCIRPCLKLAIEIESDFLFLRNDILLLFLARAGHNIVFESHYYYISNKIKRVFYSLIEYLVFRVSKLENLKIFISISHNLGCYWLKKGVSPDKIMVAHDGVDLGMFDNASDRNAYRKSLELPPDRKIVVYAGSLSTDRNIIQILKLAEEMKEVLFIIIGGASIRDMKNYRSESLSSRKNAIFTGYLPQIEVARYLLSADVLLMLWSKYVPTLKYCSPLKLFEYMAAGRIIVGHRLPSINEVIHDGEHAFLVDPDSFEDLREALIKALDEGYPCQMALKVKELVKQYTWDVRAENIIKFYKSYTNQKTT